MTCLNQINPKSLRPLCVMQALFLMLVIGLFSHNVLASETKINLNLANAEALQYIPGIGPDKSLNIIKHRTQKGEFARFEDLLAVKGIGEKTLVAIKLHGSLNQGVTELTQEMKDSPLNNS